MNTKAVLEKLKTKVGKFLFNSEELSWFINQDGIVEFKDAAGNSVMFMQQKDFEQTLHQSEPAADL